MSCKTTSDTLPERSVAVAQKKLRLAFFANTTLFNDGHHFAKPHGITIFATKTAFSQMPCKIKSDTLPERSVAVAQKKLRLAFLANTTLFNDGTPFKTV